MKSSKTKGFTLVELLVVIAIIGILSSVVLASLNNARAKANDAAVKGQLHNVSSQAQIYNDTNGNYYPGYDGVSALPVVDCGFVSEDKPFSDPSIITQITTVQARYNSTTTCAVATSSYVISAELKDGSSWCIDSLGSASSTVADTVNAVCQ